MEISNKSITMAEKRVGEMNKLTQGLLEQSNRYIQQRANLQNGQERFASQNTQFQSSPRQNINPNMQQQNMPSRNMQNGAQKPRFETVENSRQRKPQQFSPPPRPEPPKQEPPKPQPPNDLLPMLFSSDTMLLAALAALLIKENADIKLILALLYIMM